MEWTASISLEDDEAANQERFFEQVAVLGKVTARPWPTKQEIDDGLIRATRFRPRGIIQYRSGKFQATCNSWEEAAALAAAKVTVPGGGLKRDR